MWGSRGGPQGFLEVAPIALYSVSHLGPCDTQFHTSYNSDRSISLFRIQEYSIQENNNIPIKVISVNLVYNLFRIHDTVSGVNQKYLS